MRARRAGAAAGRERMGGLVRFRTGLRGADGQEPTPGSPSRGFGSGMSLATGAVTSAPVAIGGPCGAGMRARARRP